MDFTPDFYLHWWDETTRDFDPTASPVFPDASPASEYPMGYKYWRRREWSDAPQYVKEAWYIRILEKGFSRAYLQKERDKATDPTITSLLDSMISNEDTIITIQQ